MDTKFFKTAAAFRTWLNKNCSKETELWVGFYKKDSGKTGMSMPEAIEEALCAGWVDGLKGSLDEISYRIRFTPRKPKSVWSKVNIGHAERLIKEGRMTPAGQVHIDAAKADGRWDRAYEGAKNAVPPEDFLKALNKNRKAKAFYKTLDRANTFAIYFRITSAKKPETRQRWIERIITMLANGDVFH